MYLPNPLHPKEDTIQGQFLSEVQLAWTQSFPSNIGCNIKIKELSLPYNLAITGCIPFPRIRVLRNPNKICLLWIELPWPENPANTCAWHTETLGSCFDLIRSHQLSGGNSIHNIISLLREKCTGFV